MGLYMAIGVINKITFTKKEIETIKLNIEEFKDRLEKEFDLNFNLYDLKEVDEVYTFTLKDSIIDSQLKMLLIDIYPTIYDDTRDYLHILEKLNNLNSDEIIEFAKDKSEEAFQYDNYGHNDVIYGIFNNRVNISYETIMLSVEGKVSMECYDKHFNFFKKSIVKAYPKYSIINSLRVYITG